MRRSTQKHNASIATFSVAVLLLSGACKKETELIPDNQAPDYEGIPTVVVQNYVNRLYIDLIGREPLDVEMAAGVAQLESAGLAREARRTLIGHIQTNTDWLEGDSSLKYAYYLRQYDLYKSRFLEGASEDIIDGFIGNAEQEALNDSLSGDSTGLGAANSELQKLRNLKRIPQQYRDALIDVAEVMRRMVFNAVYDEINMNSFNFVNATFDNLFFRYPTDAEFNAGYGMVENNASEILFGQSGQNKADYAVILTHAPEFYEGMVRWNYRTFMGREPGTYETYTALQLFGADHDQQALQREILSTDEYAGFDQ